MRSILQLRVPEVAGDLDQRGGLITNSQIAKSPAPLRFRDPQIEMSHGAGGKASRRLVEGLFAPLLLSGAAERLADAAHFEVNGTTIAFTTDSFVVHPLTFPGGSIGELAVNGTMNDLAVSGARACAMVVTFVLEEGLASSVLEAEVRAMSAALGNGWR
jgi:hydrogenase expression/formation protein HypE